MCLLTAILMIGSHAALSVALYLPVQWDEIYWTPRKARPSILGKGLVSHGLEGLMLSQSLGALRWEKPQLLPRLGI